MQDTDCPQYWHHEPQKEQLTIKRLAVMLQKKPIITTPEELFFFLHDQTHPHSSLITGGPFLSFLCSQLCIYRLSALYLLSSFKKKKNLLNRIFVAVEQLTTPQWKRLFINANTVSSSKSISFMLSHPIEIFHSFHVLDRVNYSNLLF